MSKKLTELEKIQFLSKFIEHSPRNWLVKQENIGKNFAIGIYLVTKQSEMTVQHEQVAKVILDEKNNCILLHLYAKDDTLLNKAIIKILQIASAKEIYKN